MDALLIAASVKMGYSLQDFSMISLGLLMDSMLALDKESEFIASQDDFNRF